MSVLAECPRCHLKQGLSNKKCKGKIKGYLCELNLDKAKKDKRVRYWISFRLPGGKQRREPVGFSISEAKDADSKRKVQKRENRIFDMLPEAKMTFTELETWYLNLSVVKKLSSYDRVQQALKNFNKEFGEQLINDITLNSLEEYQERRREQGRADATVDMEIKIAQTAVMKAFDNDMLDGRCLKPFRKLKKLLKTGMNARNQLITIEQYKKLVDNAAPHYKPVLIIAYHSGMRLGEIRQLKWSYIDKKNKIIRLPKEITKESRDKRIPFNHHVQKTLESLPIALHHDFVISYKGTAMNGKNSLKKQFPETCKKAKIPYGRKIKGGITFHDLRRSAKTNMVRAGIEKVYRDTILGHSLRGMDVHYVVPTDEDLTGAMEKFTVWLDNQDGFRTEKKGKKEKVTK